MRDTDMPDTISTITQYLAVANILIPQVTSLITIGVLATQQLWSLWSVNNPDKTFEDFTAELRATAGEVKDLAAEQLRARGFFQHADGSWHKSPWMPDDPKPPVPAT